LAHTGQNVAEAGEFRHSADEHVLHHSSCQRLLPQG
jgi:hypothetical protein